MEFLVSVPLLIFSLFFACVTTPGTDRKQLNFVPDSQMNQNGEEAYRDILEKSKLSKNTVLDEEISAIGRRIATASGVNYQWEFNVIDEKDTVNAFCLPGGKVAVYTGLVPIAKNNAGLAAVLGHEVAHAVLRHSAERLSQQMVLQAGLAITSLSFQNSKYRDLIAGALGVGALYGISLPYSRFHEAEADRVGLQYMAKAGYDPREAVALWVRMAESGGSRPLEILSTHPDPTRRAKDLNRQMNEALSLYEQSSSHIQTKKL